MLWSGADGRPACPAHPVAVGDARGRGPDPGPDPGPVAGADTAGILRSLGLAEDELTALGQAGVIG